MCWMPAPTFFPLTAPTDDVAPVVDTLVDERTLRELYLRAFQTVVTQAEPAIAVIDKGIPSVDLVTWVLLAKYLDHLPLHRVASQFKRWGVEIAETTMIGWIAAVKSESGPISPISRTR